MNSRVHSQLLVLDFFAGSKAIYTTACHFHGEVGTVVEQVRQPFTSVRVSRWNLTDAKDCAGPYRQWQLSERYTWP